MSYICYLCLFVYSGIQHVLPMSSMAGVLSIRDRSCLLFASTCIVHPRFACGLSCYFLKFICFVCLRIVAFVLKDASVSGLPIFY